LGLPGGKRDKAGGRMQALVRCELGVMMQRSWGRQSSRSRACSCSVQMPAACSPGDLNIHGVQEVDARASDIRKGSPTRPLGDSPSCRTGMSSVGTRRLYGVLQRSIGSQCPSETGNASWLASLKGIGVGGWLGRGKQEGVQQSPARGRLYMSSMDA
jgi:hypothetical protein